MVDGREVEAVLGELPYLTPPLVLLLPTELRFVEAPLFTTALWLEEECLFTTALRLAEEFLLTTALRLVEEPLLTAALRWVSALLAETALPLTFPTLGVLLYELPISR